MRAGRWVGLVVWCMELVRCCLELCNGMEHWHY